MRSGSLNMTGTPPRCSAAPTREGPRPAAGAAILLFAGRRTNAWGPILGVLTVVASAVISVLMLLALMGQPAKERTVVQNVYDWVFVGSFQASDSYHRHLACNLCSHFRRSSWDSCYGRFISNYQKLCLRL